MAQTHDIEDVLSSIRRLVANAAPVDRRVSNVPALVLAQSHRVTEPEDPFQMIRSLAQDERDGRDAVHFTDALPPDISDMTHDLGETEEPPSWEPQPGATEIAAPPREPAGITGSGTPAIPATGDIPARPTSPDAAAEPTAEDSAGKRPAPLILSNLSRAVTDEDALRDLIEAIVRQELSGELGERITRNVRKLVRREIRQMLASEPFD